MQLLKLCAGMQVDRHRIADVDQLADEPRQRLQLAFDRILLVLKPDITVSAGTGSRTCRIPRP